MTPFLMGAAAAIDALATHGYPHILSGAYMRRMERVPAEPPFLACICYMKERRFWCSGEGATR